MRICILGATGLVGGETLDLVARAWPGAELALYASREREFDHRGTKHLVKAAGSLESADATGGDLAMVALDDDHSRRYVPRLRELGYRVVDKSNTYRMNPEVPLVAAGVNCGEVTEEVRLVANPNCTTIPFAMAVANAAKRFGLKSVAISSYQAISGAGVGPLREFIGGSRAAYEDADLLGEQLDATQYIGNTVPHNGKTDESGFSSEERKLMNESRKILGLPELPVCAQCCRVPVAVGHYMNAWVTLERAAKPEELEQAIADESVSPFVHLVPGAAGDGLSAWRRWASVTTHSPVACGSTRATPRAEPCASRSPATTSAWVQRPTRSRIASRWFPSADPELQAPGASPTS